MALRKPISYYSTFNLAVDTNANPNDNNNDTNNNNEGNSNNNEVC